MPILCLEGPSAVGKTAAALAARGAVVVPEAVYRPRIERGEVSFPDQTVLLEAPVAALRERKDSDTSSRRRAFERHLQFVGPQRRYVEAMQALAPGRVRFVKARDVEATALAVQVDLQCAEPGPGPVALFDALVAWLRTHAA